MVSSIQALVETVLGMVVLDVVTLVELCFT